MSSLKNSVKELKTIEECNQPTEENKHPFSVKESAIEPRTLGHEKNLNSNNCYISFEEPVTFEQLDK